MIRSPKTGIRALFWRGHIKALLAAFLFLLGCALIFEWLREASPHFYPFRPISWVGSALFLHLSATNVLFILLSIAICSFISGVFGSAGGSLLLGLLLIVLDVPTAIVLHSAALVASTAWRSILWRQYVKWTVLAKYSTGVCCAYALVAPFALAPNKPTIYLLLGTATLLARYLPSAYAPAITRRYVAWQCGFAMALLQIFAGTYGGALDACFQRSTLDRRAILATKSMVQLFAHFVRMAYFGSFIMLELDGKYEMIMAAFLISIVSVSAAGLIVERISNEKYRQWSGVIITIIGILFLIKGNYLIYRSFL